MIWPPKTSNALVPGGRLIAAGSSSVDVDYLESDSEATRIYPTGVDLLSVFQSENKLLVMELRPIGISAGGNIDGNGVIAFSTHWLDEVPELPLSLEELPGLGVSEYGLVQAIISYDLDELSGFDEQGQFFLGLNDGGSVGAYQGRVQVSYLAFEQNIVPAA